MLAVVLGLCALAVGPAVGPLLARHRALAAALDGFIVVTVTGLVVLHVLPQSVAESGVIALPVAGVGVVVPALLHRFDARQMPPALRGSRVILATALLVAAAFGHALLDGVALIDSREHHAGGTDDESLSALAIAVLLHRLPYGLALWFVGRERMGLPRTFAILAALAAGTIVGAVVGEGLVTPGTAGALALVQAFAAGAVLHVLLEAPPVDVSGAGRSSLVGVVAGVAALVALTRTHPLLAVVADELPFASTLVTLAARSAPAILAAFVVVGLLGSLGAALRPRLRADGPQVLQALSGVIAGVPVPLCSCSVVPVFEGLVRRRAGVAAAIAFLVAAPELDVLHVFLSAELLGVPLASARALGGVVIGVGAGVIVGVVCLSARAARADGPPLVGDTRVDAPARPFFDAVVGAVDHSAPWLLMGFVAAAFFEPLLEPGVLGALPTVAQVPLFAVVGVPVYLCGSGATPLAAVMLHKGASAGAVLAFLLSGPATNVTTFGLLRRVYSRRAAFAFAAAVLAVAIAAGLVIDFLGAAPLGHHAPALHDQARRAPTLLEHGSLAALAVLIAVSLARQGARGFLAQILHPLDDAKGGHVHGPHCGHSEHASVGFGKKIPVAKVAVDFKP